MLIRKLVSWLFSGIIPASAGGRWPKSHTTLPSRVYLMMLSCGWVPEIQMNPLVSAITVCSPVGHIGWPAPPHAAEHVALLIQLDQLGAAHAAQLRRRSAVAANLVLLGRVAPVQEPHVVHRVDADPGDLLHAPPVGERLRPERVDAVLRRAALVDGLSGNHLRAPDHPRAERQHARDDEGHDTHRLSW